MWLKSYFKSLTVPSLYRRKVRPCSSNSRLRLEPLEDRFALSNYAITDLGRGSSLTDINNSGLMVGSMSTIDGYSHASLWQNSTRIDLGTLGGASSEALGINEVGQVVGRSSLSNNPSVFQTHAFLITPEDTDGNGVPDRWFRDTNSDGANDLMLDLGTLGGSNAWSLAADVNNLGQVVGLAAWDSPEGYAYNAFVYQNGVMTRLQTGGVNSYATAINDAGTATGTIDFGAQGTHAFLWQNGVVTDLGASDGPADINSAGQIVDSYGLIARVWKPTVPNGTSGTFGLLGALWAGEEFDSYSFAYGINNRGQIVGNSPMSFRGGGSMDRGFIYENENAYMTELPLNIATAINDAGQIVGLFGEGARLLTPLPPVVPDTLLSVSDAMVIEGDEGATSAVFTVSLSAAIDQDVTVNYFTSDNSAFVDLDFMAANGTLRFAPGQTSQTISVPIIGDQINEPEETFFLNLTNPSNNAGITRSSGMGVIIDNDPPEISISDTGLKEGNTGTSSFTFYIALSAASAQQISVNYSTANGSAAAGSDYLTLSGTVTFAPGETSKAVTIRVKGDRLPEQNENFFVNLSNPSYASIADGQGMGTILDDEPRILISDVSKKEGNRNQITQFVFTITLSVPYDQPVTMLFATANGTATTNDNDYIAKAGTLTFAAGETTKTITIEVKGDTKKESNESFYLDLFGNSSNSMFTKNRGIGTILNDD